MIDNVVNHLDSIDNRQNLGHDILNNSNDLVLGEM